MQHDKSYHSAAFSWLLCCTVLLVACGQASSPVTNQTTTTWQDAPLLALDNEWGAFDHHQAQDAQGNTLAVWEQFDGVRFNIWANRKAKGQGWGVAQLIETDDAGSAYNPRVAIDSQGNAMAVWQQSDGQRHRIAANRYMVGTGWSKAIWIDAMHGKDAHAPQITFDRQDQAVVVWQQGDGQRSSIQANCFAPGKGWGNPKAIENGPGQANAPQIASDAHGNVIAVWHLQGKEHISVQANHHLAGTGWGSAVQIAPAKVNAYHPQIRLDTQGNAVVVWQQPQGAQAQWGVNRFALGVGWGNAVAGAQATAWINALQPGLHQTLW